MSGWRRQIMDLISPSVVRSQSMADVRIGSGILGDAGDVATGVTDSHRAVVIADDAGFGAAGQATVVALARVGFETETLVVPSNPSPEASFEAAEPFRAALAAGPDMFPVSVGSGVVNDLVKYAAFQTDRRYMTVTTAASMDGYISAGAPLAKDGFRITFSTRAPMAMMADLDVISSAPTEMNGWGHGDLAGNIPAGGDWIIADALGVEPIDDVAWPLVQDHLRDWLSHPAEILENAFDAVARLFIGLTVAGFAMEFYGSTRPASGADHQIAHLWEMEGRYHNGQSVSHGASVAVGCVAALAIYDWLLRQDLTALDSETLPARASDLETRPRALKRDIPNQRVAAKAEDEIRAKHLDPVTHRERLETLKREWPRLRSRLSDHLVRHDDMAAMPAEAGAPAFAHQIGISPVHLPRTMRAAQHIRRRYTVLDLLYETGLTETALDAVRPMLNPPKMRPRNDTERRCRQSAGRSW